MLLAHNVGDAFIDIASPMLCDIKRHLEQLSIPNWVHLCFIVDSSRELAGLRACITIVFHILWNLNDSMTFAFHVDGH